MEQRPHLEPETLELIFEMSRHSPEDQLRASDAVDSKIFQAFAVASVLIGLAAIHGPKHDNLETGLLAAAVGAFLNTRRRGDPRLWSRAYRVGIGPTQLWQSFWLDTPETIKHAFVDDIASGYVENDGHLASKHRALRFVLIALVIEAGAIGAALIASAAR